MADSIHSVCQPGQLLDGTCVMNVLVIGGNGFIGSHVVDALLQSGVRVAVFDRGPEKFRPPLSRVKYYFGSLRDRASLERPFAEGIDAVIHLASTSGPKISNDEPACDVENIAATLVLLDVCVKFGVKRIVFASSGGTVYGIPQILPIPESHSTEPICSYGIGKLTVEKYLQLYQHLHSTSCVILRLANPYGMRQCPESAQGVIPIFMSRMLKGEPLTIWGDGSFVRDFVSVRDIARLFLCAVASESTGIFNAGSGIGTSVNQLVNLLSSMLQIEPTVVRQSPRRFDIPAVVLNCQKAKDVFGWEPKITLNEGILEVARWLELAGSRQAPVFQ